MADNHNDSYTLTCEGYFRAITLTGEVCAAFLSDWYADEVLEKEGSFGLYKKEKEKKQDDGENENEIYFCRFDSGDRLRFSKQLAKNPLLPIFIGKHIQIKFKEIGQKQTAFEIIEIEVID